LFKEKGSSIRLLTSNSKLNENDSLIMKETSVTLISPHTDRTELVSMMRGKELREHKHDYSLIVEAVLLKKLM